MHCGKPKFSGKFEKSVKEYGEIFFKFLSRDPIRPSLRFPCKKDYVERVESKVSSLLFSLSLSFFFPFVERNVTDLYPN